MEMPAALARSHRGESTPAAMREGHRRQTCIDLREVRNASFMIHCTVIGPTEEEHEQFLYMRQ